MKVYKKKGSKCYYFNYHDESGCRRFKSTGTTDKRAAEAIAAKHKTDAALRKHSIIDTKAEAVQESLASKIDSHIDEYEKSMRAKSITVKHVESSRNILDRLVASSGIQSLGEFNESVVHDFIENLGNAGRSKRTIESNLQAIKAFSKWLVKSMRLPTDPLVSVEKPKSSVDKVLVRRALSHDEWILLDDYVRSSPTSYGMTGRERALLYATAVQTGLRANELRSVLRASLNLSGKQPSILVKAKNTKNQKIARQYIQPELASELVNLTAKKLAGAVVFPMPSKFDLADMLRKDIQGARANWLSTFTDPQQRIEAEASDFLQVRNSLEQVVDFHSLRHTTATWLIEAGADPKTVQSVMRHSVITLTMDTYGHLFPGQEAQAVAMIRHRFREPLQATGTEPTGTILAQLARDLVPVRATQCENEAVVSVTNEERFAKEITGETKENIEETISRARRARTFDLRIRKTDLESSFFQCFSRSKPLFDPVFPVSRLYTFSQGFQAFSRFVPDYLGTFPDTFFAC
ncbi:tyrosine-type recombinase/integrase [Pirellulaceae bacterium SH449]